MEDGDGSLCTAATGGPGGAWQMVVDPGTLTPAATTVPPAGPLLQTDPEAAATLPVALEQSTRGIEMKGVGFTMASNATAVLAAGFAAPIDLSTFSSIQFWALSDRDTMIRVNVGTAADPPSGASWGLPVRLGQAWTQVIVPLANLTMEFGASSTKDLTATGAIDFKYSYFLQGVSGAGADPTNLGTFDIWIDDVQLTP